MNSIWSLLLLFIVLEIIAIAVSWKWRKVPWIIGANFIFCGIVFAIIFANQWPGVSIFWLTSFAWIGLMILTADAHYSYSYEH